MDIIIAIIANVCSKNVTIAFWAAAMWNAIFSSAEIV